MIHCRTAFADFVSTIRQLEPVTDALESHPAHIIGLNVYPVALAVIRVAQQREPQEIIALCTF
ncbi:MAG: hypothetical protein IKS83_09245 [Victivallales bacterium]|nr:hypothetical protein [Victivallales bacterium]